MTKWLPLLLAAVVVGALVAADDGRGYPRGGGGTGTVKASTSVTSPLGKFDVLDAGVALINGQLETLGPVVNIGTGVGFSSAAASGTNALSVVTNGGRVDFGAGTSDYASSDGTTVTFAGPVASAASSNTLAFSSAGYFQSTSAGTAFSIGTAGGQFSLAAAMLFQRTAPTISSGFGTSPSIVASNGSAAFEVNVGGGGAATSGVIGLPTATTGWNCACTDITTASATVFLTKQTASATTSCTVGNFNTAGAAAAWVASDKLRCIAMAY